MQTEIDKRMKKVVLITGASSGMGKATAMLLAEQGYQVYGAARKIERATALAAAGVKCINLDITNEASLRAAMQKIQQAEGRIDILINNAGFGLYGAVEDVDMDDARYQLEVNLLGMARLIQLVVPYMRQQKSGKIINISSIGGRLVGPFGAWYHVSKFGVEALGDALRLELNPFGIDVITIQPGGIRTEWGGIAMDNLNKTSGDGPYGEMVAKVIESNNKLSTEYSNPAVIANLILKAIQAKKPKTRYHAGYMSGMLLFLKKVVPDRILDKMMLSQLKK